MFNVGFDESLILFAYVHFFFSVILSLSFYLFRLLRDRVVHSHSTKCDSILLLTMLHIIIAITTMNSIYKLFV